MRGLRKLLVVVLVLGLAFTMAGQPSMGRHSATSSSWPSFLGGARKALRGLVDAPDETRKPKARPIARIALPRKDRAPAGKRLRKPKRVKELRGRRTATSRQYLLSDGRIQAQLSSGPINYRDAHGRYQRIDTTVRPSSHDGYRYGVTRNTFASYFGTHSDRMVGFDGAGTHLTLGPAGDRHRVTPRVKGNTVSYPDAVPGATLTYRVTPRELKENIVLRTRPRNPVYRFRLSVPDGLWARPGKHGTIVFFRHGVTDRPVLVMPRPFMYDSRHEASSPYGTAWSPKVHQSVEQHGHTVTVTLTADKAWLSAKARRYPVTIDPTIEIAPPPSQSQDAMILSDAPDTNYDGNWRLSVGTTSDGQARSLVRFDLSGIPSGTRLDTAQLRMYYDQSHTTDADDVPLEARRVTAAWDESTVTWNSAHSNIGAQGATVVQVDDSDTADTAINGEWPASGSSLTQYAIGGTYHYNENATTGETFTWVPQLPEDGQYEVQVHYVAAFDRATAAPYTVHYNGGSKTVTVDQTQGSNGTWASLGTYPFVAGTQGKVVLGDVSDSSQAVIADAVRFIKAGTVVRKAGVSSVWHSYDIRNIAQDWLDGTEPNYGVALKAVDENTLGQGGPRYEASEYAYNGENENYPQLLLTYGRPGVTLDAPQRITATGAELRWSAYQNPDPSDSGGDIVEYQVHRSVYQHFTPSAATLVAPVDPGTTTFTDTTATPTPADSTDPFGRLYYYMVAVKTRDGTVIPAPTQIARLPKAGRVVQVLQGNAPDTTLTSAQPDTNQDTLAGQPWLMVGNNSTTYGTSRAVVDFPNLASTIPAGARVEDATLTLWSVTTIGAGASYQAHALTRGFDESTATWNDASSGTGWSTAGGDLDPTVLDTIDQITNDPARRDFSVGGAVQGWLDDPSSNHGIGIKLADEAGPAERTLFLSSEAAEPQLRPDLVVTYTQKTAASTYYAPDTPPLMLAGNSYTTPVTVTNTTDASLSAGDYVLSYRWALPDGTDVTTSANQVQTPLPSTLAPDGTVTVQATVQAPTPSTPSNGRNGYTLKWGLYNRTTGTWLSTSDGVPELDQHTSVEQPTSDQLGLEKFYQYSGQSTGGGGTLLTNVHAGNAVWSYNAFSHPSRGLATFVRLAYNSLDTSDTVAGYGWSLQASSLMRLGTPLDFHPNPNPTTVRLTDGDGTTHTWSWDSTSSTWISPHGVHLYLQQIATCPTGNSSDPPARAWSMTSPDRTQFFFDCDGYLTAVADKNDNELLFTYAQRKSNNAPTKFLRYITDPASRRTLSIDYYAKGDDYSYIDDSGTEVSGSNLTNPHIIDKIRSVTDIAGRTLSFTYSDKGLLRRLVDGSGTSVAKTFRFTYDMTQGNKNVKLVTVTDPRGHDTKLSYYDAPTDPTFKWWLHTVTDRLGEQTSFAYTDPDGSQGDTLQTSVTDPEQHTSTYATDGYGRPTAVTNAKDQTTQLGWDADHNVTSLTEANGAKTTWTYDPKTGYPLSTKDAEANANDTAGTTFTYNTGLDGHVADLTGKTSPEGRAWAFGYDSLGNLTSVTDPAGTATSTSGDYTTTYAYDSYGQLTAATDANGHTTKYSDYAPVGYPKTITDALGHDTTSTYDSRGDVTAVTDAAGKTSSYGYDIFGRPLDSSVPKDAANGVYITTPAPTYDANDNVVKSTAPNGAVRTYSYDADDRMVTATDPKDTSASPERTTSYGYDKVGNLTRVTTPNGTLTSSDLNDYTTTYGYDEIYQLVSKVDAAGNTTTYGYDKVGNLTTLVRPRQNNSSDPNAVTETYTYDLNHQVLSATDAAGNTTRGTYDHDGNLISVTDPDGNTTSVTLNPRGLVTQVKVPHDPSGSTPTYRTTQYQYDQVGNRTKIISPRGVETTSQAADYTTTLAYDALNRVSAETLPYNPDDPTYNKPDKITASYDAVGNLTALSAPPSQEQTVRNTTRYSYYDNGWIKSSTNPWNIVTSYDYNALGQQTKRTVTDGSGSLSRSMSWGYYPDGTLASRTDDGVPVGAHVVLVDNSDTQNISATGTWATSSGGSGFQGYDYRTHAAGSGAETFTWTLNVPADGTYQVFARYPKGTATNAPYTIEHSGTSTTRSIDQSANFGQWVSLGSYSFTAGNTQSISLSDKADGTVVADAVKLVRDHSGDTDTEKKTYSYSYDPDANLTGITDNSSGALIDTYAISYTGLDQVAQVQEKATGVVKHTTGYSYDADGDLTRRTHDAQVDSFAYGVRDLVSKVTNAQSASDPNPKITSYTYTPLALLMSETKANGNTVDYTYFADGLLKHQVEKKPGGTTVAEHTLAYDANGNRTSDTAKTMNADNHSAYLDRAIAYTYDPRDRVTSVTKTNTDTGVKSDTESYAYDANDNVTSQTLNGTTTSYRYDRNRLQEAISGSATATYNYDPFGRLDTVTSAGQQIEHNVYDGFDRRTEHTGPDSSGAISTISTTRYTYDPLDRTVSTTTDVGTSNAKTTDYAYLGLTNQLLSESVAGKTTKTYQYGPNGERLSQTTIKSDGSQDDAYYGYNPHSDVQELTDQNGDTTATYGYTAYGKNDTTAFTGADKPDPQDPTKQTYNPYRFNAKRYDPASGSYDMGFRDYNPGLNRFLTRDSYAGALSDMRLSTDVWTNNRYAFAGGNPITGIELDGHEYYDGIDMAGDPTEDVLPGGAVESEMGEGETVVKDGKTTPAGERLAKKIERIENARESRVEAEEPEPLTPEQARLRDNYRDPAIVARQAEQAESRYEEPEKPRSKVGNTNEHSTNGHEEKGPIQKDANVGAPEPVSPKLNKTFQFPGAGRSGSRVKNFVGPPNSVARGAHPGRVYVTDDQGRVIMDITKDRAKPVIPGQGFVRGDARKQTPSQEQLNWINELWGYNGG